MAKTKTAEVAELITEEVPKEEVDTIDPQIKGALTKYNITDKILDDLKKKYKDLIIKDFTDKEGYEAVHEARMEFANTRVLITKICKAGREVAVMIQKKWIAKQDELIDRISPDENRLKKMEQDYEAEKERKKEECKEMERLRLRTRTAELLAMGAVSDNVSVYLDEVSFDVTDIREAEEEDYQNDILPLYKKIFDSKEKDRLESEEKKRQDQKKIDDEKAEFERQKLKLKEDQEKLDNDRKEADHKKRSARVAQLEAIGMTPQFPSGHYIYESVVITVSTIDTATDDQWDQSFDAVKEAVNSAKDALAKKKQQEEDERLEQARKKAAAELLVKEREAQLRGMHFGREGGQNEWCMYKGEISEYYAGVMSNFNDHIEFSSEEGWISFIKEWTEWSINEDKALEIKHKDRILKEENERKEKLKQQQQEDADQASDKDKWVAFMSELNAIKIPTMKRQPYKEYVETAVSMIKKINAIKK